MGKKIETEMQGGSRKDKEAEGGHVSSTQGGRTEGQGHWCPVPTCGETAPTAPPPPDCSEHHCTPRPRGWGCTRLR